jgi:hypothetical protein
MRLLENEVIGSRAYRAGLSREASILQARVGEELANRRLPLGASLPKFSTIERRQWMPMRDPLL